MREKDYYELDEEELRRQRIREIKRKRRLKKKIKRYAKFFGAWAVVIGCAVLVIIGVIKLGGLIVGAISGKSDTEVVDAKNTGEEKQEAAPTEAVTAQITPSASKSDFDPSTSIVTSEADREKLVSAYYDSSYSFKKPSKTGLIIIDAGHGGYDGGTSSGDVCEKDINLDIAYWLKEELEFRGYETYLTRTDDTFVGLSKRATLANEHPEALCFVSVHQNSIDGHDYIKGVEGWTHNREGCELLASSLSAGVAASTGTEDRGVAFRKALVVCRDTKMPAAIIECGYMSNPEDLSNLQLTDYQVKIARGIADGIGEFIDAYYK